MSQDFVLKWMDFLVYKYTSFSGKSQYFPDFQAHFVIVE